MANYKSKLDQRLVTIVILDYPQGGQLPVGGCDQNLTQFGNTHALLP